MKLSHALLLAAAVATTTAFLAAPDASFPVTITVDAAKPVGAMKPIWRFFGADEPNYATMKDGRKLLADIGSLRPGDTYFRTHNLLCTGDGTPALKWGSTNAYTEDASGNPVYDWKILDEIFDTYLERGVRPFAQIGFMPKALSIHPEPYQHHWKPGLKYGEIITGWAYPPKDYDKWRELVYQWVKHCVDRYGRAEVEKWYWEVWNEPNGSYWKATPEEFYKLHDYAIDGVRRALPTARVGGPDVAGSGGKFMDGFLKHVVSGKNYATGEIGTPTDFLAFHAKGSPTFVDGHVRLGIANQLRTIDDGFARIAAIPELKTKPIVIGESDPDGCAACQGPQLGYRNTTMYSSYTAAVFARKYELADRHGVDLDGALTWAFEFEGQPWFAGFRVLASNGITLPVFNVFRMFREMGGQRVAVESTADVPLDTMMKDGVRKAPDVTALASLEDHKLALLVWHYHDDDIAGPAADVTLDLTGLPAGAKKAKIRQFLIDETHSNAFTAWKKQGSPAAPSPAQYAELEAASQLASVPPSALAVGEKNQLSLKFPLPRQAVSLLVLEW
jgi:xylan 1,4-beta-xylosidase